MLKILLGLLIVKWSTASSRMNISHVVLHCLPLPRSIFFGKSTFLGQEVGKQIRHTIDCRQNFLDDRALKLLFLCKVR